MRSAYADASIGCGTQRTQLGPFRIASGEDFVGTLTNAVEHLRVGEDPEPPIDDGVVH